MHSILACLCEQSCVACGSPEAVDLDGRLCAACAGEIPTVLSRIIPKDPTSVRGGWALGPYAGPAGALVRNGKYAGDEGGLRILGECLASMMVKEDARIDLVVPAPTSPGRSIWRGFDAVHMLAKPVARRLSVPMIPALRRWGGAPQASLSPEARRENLKGRLRLTRPLPVGARILLVDDVRTTGATGEICADVLMGAGAEEVWLLVVCG